MQSVRRKWKTPEYLEKDNGNKKIEEKYILKKKKIEKESLHWHAF